MAEFYSGSNYLLKNDIKFFTICIAVLLLPTIVSILAWIFLSKLVTLIIVIVSLGTLLIIAKPFSEVFERKSDRFFLGRSGEKVIKQELAKLSNDYSVFADVYIGTNKGNIDFVVVGPSGIYIVEVKSHKGSIDFNGFDLTRNGRRFEKNIINQVHGQTFALRNYLKEKTGKDLYINSVLVFSSKYAKMRFGLKPVANIQIVQKNFLLEIFDKSSKYNYPVARDLIEQSLKPIK